MKRTFLHSLLPAALTLALAGSVWAQTSTTPSSTSPSNTTQGTAATGH